MTFGEGKAAPELPGELVGQRRGRNGRLTVQGNHPSEAPTACDTGIAGIGRGADVSVPCQPSGYAIAPDRDGTVSVPRVQAESEHHGRFRTSAFCHAFLYSIAPHDGIVGWREKVQPIF